MKLRPILLLLLAATPALADFEPCTPAPPQNEYGAPLCADYDLDTGLIAAAEKGDASAITLLEKRYALAETYVERQRIARTLLGRVADDSAIWNEVFENARLALRFPTVVDGETPEELVAWCEERGFDPFEHGAVLDRAFSIAAHDPRGHAMLVEALDSAERNIALTAASTLALENDTAALDGIARVLQRFSSDSFSIAAIMSESMTDPRAQALARKYLGDD